jgi:hypothetical protein
LIPVPEAGQISKINKKISVLPAYIIDTGTAPEQERLRLQALLSYNILDTLAEQAFDERTLLATHHFDVPIALASLIDRDRHWFKSRIGLDATQTVLSLARLNLCA